MQRLFPTRLLNAISASFHIRLALFRQRFEQYLTSSQTFAHFLRHSNGRPQTTQVLIGFGSLALRFPVFLCGMVNSQQAV